MKKFHLKPTDAERIFKDSPLINERPEGMSMEQYKIVRKLQTKALRFALRK